MLSQSLEMKWKLLEHELLTPGQNAFMPSEPMPLEFRELSVAGLRLQNWEC